MCVWRPVGGVGGSKYQFHRLLRQPLLKHDVDLTLKNQSIATLGASASLPLPRDWRDAFPRVSLTVASQTFNGVASFCTAPGQGFCGEGTAKPPAYPASVTTSRPTLTPTNGANSPTTSVPNMLRSSNWFQLCLGNIFWSFKTSLQHEY